MLTRAYTESEVELNKEQMIHAKIKRIFGSPTLDWASTACCDDNDKEFRAAGKIFDAQPDSEYDFTGVWTVHEKFGLQFKVIGSKINATITKDGILAFLSSGFISGLGLKKAQKIVDMFGLQTYEIIENSHHRLTEVKGITMPIADKIRQTYIENTALRSLREFLPPEITDNKVVALYARYKEKSIAVLEKNPYQIIKDVDGIGFLTADKMATAMGVKRDDPRRVNAGIIYCLQEVQQAGHCFSYTDSLEHNLEQLVGDVPVELVADEIKTLQDNGEIVIDTDGAIYHAAIYKAEIGVAEILKKMITYPPTAKVSKSDIEIAKRRIEKRTGFSIERKQLQAVELAFKNSLSIITGGPGTGKTTIIQLILEAWGLHNSPELVALAAPTGKAARRMSEVTMFTAGTIHQLLRYVPPHERNAGEGMFVYTKVNPCPYQLFIVDEASMLDIQMAYTLLQAVRDGARIILIGDINQLPPIGPGNFFRDMVTSYKIPSVKLELSFRQSGKIAVNANKIMHGEGAHAFVQDNSFIFKRAKKSEIQGMVINEYLDMAKAYGVKDCTILSPMKKRSSTGTRILNQLIQERINPVRSPDNVIKSGMQELRLGDRVIQTKNAWNHNVANGEMGFVKEITKSVVTVLFDSGVEVEYSRMEVFSNTLLGYAITIHKSQGSEYEAVVIAHNSEHSFMVQRNLLYTAVTRAKGKVVLIGDAKTIAKAVENVVPITRNTKLKERF